MADRAVMYFVPKIHLTPEQRASWNPKETSGTGSDAFGMWFPAGNLTGDDDDAIESTARGDETIPVTATKVKFFDAYEAIA